MELHGKNIIAGKRTGAGETFTTATNPASGSPLSGRFAWATPEEIDAAVTAAAAAFTDFSRTTPGQRAVFLEAVGDRIMAAGDTLVQRAMQETALPEARIVSERGRTVGQLQAFAAMLREGSWVAAIIDTADPGREPVPKPDVRRMLVPTGPVGVFAASNFPLAFSVAGGDTASALAVGNPVIVKAHSGHPGTSERVAEAVATAAADTGMPPGVFSLLHGGGSTVGQALVTHPALTAVGFTGSRHAGLTLQRLAAARDVPIPVFAEMGSINPVFLAPGALDARAGEIAALYAGSITLGVGQFCTNPGLLFGLAGETLDRFIALLGKEIAGVAPASMLNASVYAGFREARKAVMSQAETRPVAELAAADDPSRLEARPTLVQVDGRDFLANPVLHREVFGPFAVVVGCRDRGELLAVAQSVEGQLTATVMAEPQELADYADVADALAQRCGRIINNGVPTGVEVCAAMHHGGPYPASTDARFTSVGITAVHRFVRPLAFQNWPDAALPDALKDANPLGILRLVNNEWTRNEVVPTTGT